MQNKIEAQHYSEAAADGALEKALKGKKGRLTKADAIAVSGLPAYVVDDSLERLLHRYRSRLEVTDDGELLYSFDPALVRRDEPTLAERARAAGRVLARVGMWVFKAWIAVTLVVYVVAFIALMIAMMVSGGDRRRDDRGGGLGWLWWFFLPDMRYGGGYGYQRDPWGRPIQPAPDRRRLDGPKKKFISSVFDYVFGPATPERDKLADEREVLAYLREHDGRITATDLVGMFGWSYTQAEEEVTRLLVDYDGDPIVTDGGVIIYEFPKLLKSGSETEMVPWKHAWERTETRPVLTGNTSGTDTLISVFAAFNVIVSFFAASWARMRFGLVGPTWQFLLTGFPLAFFTIFLSIPGVRALGRKLGDRGREERNERRKNLKRVMDAGGAALPADPGLDALLLPLEGEPEVGPAGQQLVRFPRIAEEREALQKHLAGVDLGAEKRIGKVIFGGDDDDVEKTRRELEADYEKDRPQLKS